MTASEHGSSPIGQEADVGKAIDYSKARGMSLPQRLEDVALSIGMKWAWDTAEHRQYAFDTLQEAAKALRLTTSTAGR